MSNDKKASIAGIFDQLRLLRQSVSELEAVQEAAVTALRGHQTVDSEEAVRSSFANLQDQIGGMEETLAAIAEAAGEISKL